MKNDDVLFSISKKEVLLSLSLTQKRIEIFSDILRKKRNLIKLDEFDSDLSFSSSPHQFGIFKPFHQA